MPDHNEDLFEQLDLNPRPPNELPLTDDGVSQYSSAAAFDSRRLSHGSSRPVVVLQPSRSVRRSSRSDSSQDNVFPTTFSDAAPTSPGVRSPNLHPAGTFPTQQFDRANDYAPLSSSTSTHSSTRSWVHDPDSSSLCSRRSSCWSGTGEIEEVEDGKVYKPEKNADGIECEVLKRVSPWVQRTKDLHNLLAATHIPFNAVLDQRPEPPGAQIWIDRDDPHRLVVNVTLPGFNLENITVAFRRHHKLHILADKYGENGGHYERTIALGPDVSSRSNRAAFDGTTLQIFIDRRPPRPITTTLVGTSAALLDDTANVNVLNSPASSTGGLSLHSPSLENPSGSAVTFLSDSPADAPIAMCTTEKIGARPRGKSHIGPEGAKAAARAARDEAMQRAKDAFQSITLAKAGSKESLRFDRDRERERERERERGEQEGCSTSPTTDSLRAFDRAGTIKGRSHSPSSTSSQSFSSSGSRASISTAATDISESSNNLPSRPPYFERATTLRAKEKGKLSSIPLSSSVKDQSDASTPRTENLQQDALETMRFPPHTSTNLSDSTHFEA